MTDVLTEDQVRWGAASMLLQQHRADAPRKVAERIGELALEHDAAGVALWTGIARRMDEMIKAPPQ